VALAMTQTVEPKARQRTLPCGRVQVPQHVVPSLNRAETDRLVNLGLAALLISAIVSGLASETAGTPAGRWLIIVHGISGLGLLLLSRRKTHIATRSLNRPRRREGWRSSLVLAALVVITVITGLIESTGVTYWLGPLSVMQVHIGAAVLAIPLAIQHFRRRPVRLRPSRRTGRVTDPGRRTVLRAAAVGAAAGGAWLGWERVLDVTGVPGATRRFTPMPCR
jgi:hypothetical protein